MKYLIILSALLFIGCGEKTEFPQTYTYEEIISEKYISTDRYGYDRFYILGEVSGRIRVDTIIYAQTKPPCKLKFTQIGHFDWTLIDPVFKILSQESLVEQQK